MNTALQQHMSVSQLQRGPKEGPMFVFPLRCMSPACIAVFLSRIVETDPSAE
jgi:hypothetical protein